MTRNPQSRALRQARRSVRAAAGLTATYRRGATVFSIAVVPFNPQTQAEDYHGALVGSTDPAFMLDLAELAAGLAEPLARPERADLIQILWPDGTHATYQVTAPAGRRRPWEPHGPDHEAALAYCTLYREATTTTPQPITTTTTAAP